MYLPNFKLISPNVSVYLVYAGVGRRHFDLFRRSNSIFLELPGFRAAQETFSSDPDIIRHLRMSQEVAAWIRGKRSSPPSRNVANYPASLPDARTREGRAFITDFASTRKMYHEMKVGDLVICTPEGHYNRCLIGEIQSPWRADDVVSPDSFREELVPIRRVRWLATDISRRDFSADVAKRLQNRRAITAVSRDLFEPIFRLVYPAYIWGNQSKLDIYAPQYRHNDPTQPYSGAFLLKWAIAAYAAYHSGQIEEFSALPLDVAAHRFFDASIIESLGQSFNSPGWFKLLASGAGVAVLVAGLVSIATSEEHIPIHQVKSEVSSEVASVGLPDESEITSDDVRAVITSLETPVLEELRRTHGRAARNELGLTLDKPREMVGAPSLRQP